MYSKHGNTDIQQRNKGNTQLIMEAGEKKIRAGVKMVLHKLGGCEL